MPNEAAEVFEAVCACVQDQTGVRATIGHPDHTSNAGSKTGYLNDLARRIEATKMVSQDADVIAANNWASQTAALVLSTSNYVKPPTSMAHAIAEATRARHIKQAGKLERYGKRSKGVGRIFRPIYRAKARRIYSEHAGGQPGRELFDNWAKAKVANMNATGSLRGEYEQKVLASIGNLGRFKEWERSTDKLNAAIGARNDTGGLKEAMIQHIYNITQL